MRAEQRSVHIPNAHPLAYFITFTTHGSWLHGDERGSVDPWHNQYESPTIDRNDAIQNSDRKRMRRDSVVLNAEMRRAVEVTIRNVCNFRDWTLYALNVRTNHVHVVVSAEQSPERVMNTLKSWSTRRLREANLYDCDHSPWTRHGSTRYLWNDEELQAAGKYTVEGQGDDI